MQTKTAFLYVVAGLALCVQCIHAESNDTMSDGNMTAGAEQDPMNTCPKEEDLEILVSGEEGRASVNEGDVIKCQHKEKSYAMQLKCHDIVGNLDMVSMIVANDTINGECKCMVKDASLAKTCKVALLMNFTGAAKGQGNDGRWLEVSVLEIITGCFTALLISVFQVKHV